MKNIMKLLSIAAVVGFVAAGQPAFANHKEKPAAEKEAKKHHGKMKKHEKKKKSEMKAAPKPLYNN